MKEEMDERPEGKQSKNERIESFLREHYDFRFNTVKSRTEFRYSNKDEPFYPLGKFDINSMRRLLDSSQGISTWRVLKKVDSWRDATSIHYGQTFKQLWTP